MFELVEHTADIGFRAAGNSPAELFESAAQALVSIALEPEDIQPSQEYPLAAEGHDWHSLLVNWLSEVLYRLDGERIAMRHFRVTEISETRVIGRAAGERRDPARHRAKLVVKGVTYHQLEIGPDASGVWRAQVILDI